jgi:hypothetical protein
MDDPLMFQMILSMFHTFPSWGNFPQFFPIRNTGNFLGSPYQCAAKELTTANTAMPGKRDTGILGNA